MNVKKNRGEESFASICRPYILLQFVFFSVSIQKFGGDSILNISFIRRFSIS